MRRVVYDISKDSAHHQNELRKEVDHSYLGSVSLRTHVSIAPGHEI